MRRRRASKARFNAREQGKGLTRRVDPKHLSVYEVEGCLGNDEG